MKKENNEFKHKTREIETKENLIKHLNRIEGQVRGIKQMINDDRYCNDILIQISAVNKSLKSIGGKILEDHMKSCVVDEIKKGNNAIIDELASTIAKMN